MKHEGLLVGKYEVIVKYEGEKLKTEEMNCINFNCNILSSK